MLWRYSSDFDPLRPFDAILWHGYGLTLVQEMACCLITPSRYLNQCWLIITWGQFHKKCSRSVIRRFNCILNYIVATTIKFARGTMTPGLYFNIRITFPVIGVHILKIRWSWYCLIFIMGIPLPVRWDLYTEMCPGKKGPKQSFSTGLLHVIDILLQGFACVTLWTDQPIFP